MAWAPRARARKWGSMIANERQMLVEGWWIALWPGVAVLLTVFGFNLLGHWLGDRQGTAGLQD